MKTDLAAYLHLLRLVDDASRELGLSHLTASDTNVLLALTAFADKSNNAAGFTYSKYCNLVGCANAVSRAQFFKSLDNLLISKAIRKADMNHRSASYVIAE